MARFVSGRAAEVVSLRNPEIVPSDPIVRSDPTPAAPEGTSATTVVTAPETCSLTHSGFQ